MIRPTVTWGRKFRDGDFEQHGVQQAEGERHDTGGDGDPQGPKDGSPVALLNVLPAELQPQLMLLESADDIVPGSAKGH